MGVKENAAAVRKDLDAHAQKFFIAFFTKFPAHQNVFPKYVGKPTPGLTSEPSFPIHTRKVLDRLLKYAEQAGDSGDLTAAGKEMAAMPVHKDRKVQEYKDLFTALIPYLESNLGGACDSSGWQKFGNNLVAATQAAM